jgi:hypothetical protein
MSPRSALLDYNEKHDDVRVIVVDAADGAEVASDFETAMARLRQRYGAGIMPRTVNMITGRRARRTSNRRSCSAPMVHASCM